MTAVPPRRLRPSPERRAEVAVNTHTALSAKGAVSVAAPVDPNRGRSHPYVPPSVGNVVSGIQFDTTGTSITSTTAGSGSSEVDAPGGVAIGRDAADHGAYAGDENAVAIGGRTAAGGVDSVAIGYYASASADGNTTAIGSNTTASGSDSTAIGFAAITSEDHCIAIGPSAQANRSHGIAIGSNARAGALSGTTEAIAIGRLASAIGKGSVAIGRSSAGVSASAPNSDDFVLGTSTHKVSVPGLFAVHGATPVAQSAAPTTLADVIAILRAHGLCA